METEEIFLDSNLKVHCVGSGKMSYGMGSDKILHFLVKKLPARGMRGELCIRITDDKDPLLLYSCRLCEEDYMHLQQMQGLLVDFAAFPHHLISLVKHCTSESGSSSPKFSLLLRESQTVSLEILEINVFRHLCHLQLNLVPADLQTKLSHLSSCISEMKITHSKETKALKHQESSLVGQRQHLEKLLKEQHQKCDQLKKELESVTYRSGQQQNLIQAAEREKFLRFQSDLERKMAREKKELQEKYSKQLINERERAESLSRKLDDVITSKNLLEEGFRNSQDRNGQLEREFNLQQMELTEIKKRKSILEHEAQSHYESVQRLEAENARLQMESAAALEIRQVLSTTQQDKIQLQEALTQALEKVKKREEKVAHVFQELQKSWQVIQKLDTKLKNGEKNNTDLEGKIITYNKMLSEKDKDISSYDDQIKKLEDQLSIEKSTNTEQKAELEKQSTKLQEIEATLRTKENVISWLKKQLSEAETSGDIMKKAPLGEAYLGHSNYSDLPSSTPLSAGIKPHRENLGLSAVKPVLPEITEEKKSDENKENKLDVDGIYVEKQAAPKRIGLIRSSAVPRPPGPTKPGLCLPKKKQQKKKNAYFNTD